MSTKKPEGSARARLLAAADELFYEEGIHSVGIDRVIERAGVAKASLYSTFGSKEELVRAYLEARAESRRARVTQHLARYDDPRARILGVFELLAETAAQPTFRGCAFARANADGPRGETKVSAVCSDARAWTRQLFTTLARECGASGPEKLGRQLALLYDGATLTAAMERDVVAARDARDAAEQLLAVHTQRRGSRRINSDGMGTKS